MTTANSELLKRKLAVTLYKNERSKTPYTASTIEPEKLSAILSTRKIRPDKSGPGLSLLKLKEGGTRRNADVVFRSGIECDIDAGATLDDVREAIDAYWWFAYSTHSHAPANGKVKLRVVLPFNRDVTPSEWPHIWQGCNELLGGVLDPSTKDISRLVYLPSCPAFNEQHAFNEHHDGELIDPNTLIALAQQEIPSGNHLALNAALEADMKSPPPAETAQEVDRVKSMLAAIPADCERSTWLKIIWAVASSSWTCAENMAREWSMTAPNKYDGDAFNRDWNSFDPKGGIGLGTLFHYAEEAGWRDSGLQLSTDTAHDDTSGDIKNGKAFSNLFRDKLLFVHETNDILKFEEDTGWIQARPGEADRAGKEVVARMRAVAAEQWKLNPEDHKTKRLMQHVDRSSTEQRISAMINMAQSEPGMTLRLCELDADPMLLGVANGVLDLRSGKLMCPAPSLLITKRCPVSFDPSATAPTISAFIARITQGDPPLAKFLQRLAGYMLTGEVNEQCFAFLYGLGRNGKTTYAELLFWLLGDYAVVLPTATLMMGKRDPGACSPDLMLLKGRRLALASELEETARFAEAAIKSMTGGDTMTARNPYGKFASWTPTHKLMIVGNHRPVISGGDHGIWRRVRLIPFSEIISDSECDSKLSEKLRAEGSGVLNWALAGLRDWQQQELNPPASVKAAVATYHSDMDILGQWLDDHTEAEPGARTETAMLYRAYSCWAKDSGWTRPMTRNAFGRRLTDRGIITSKASNGNKCANGIRFNAEGQRAAAGFI